MKFIAVLLCCSAAAFGGETHLFKEHFPLSFDGRVVGGKEADPHSAPYIVSITYFGGHNCGGSVISKDWILTAGHCLTSSPRAYTIVAGLHNVKNYGHSYQERKIDYYTVHEKYGGSVGPFDIAVAHLSKPFEFNEHVQPIGLPHPEKIHSGNVTLFGWGSISKSRYPNYPDELQTVVKPIVDHERCLKALGSSSYLLHKNNVCTGPLSGGISACSGDSGGPLVQVNEAGKLELVGLVSWGKVPCGGFNNPSVYTRVSAYNNWIKNNLVAFHIKRLTSA